MIVLDASAACEIIMQSDIGLAIESLLYEDEEIVSCELIMAEIASVFRKLVLNRQTNVESAVEHLLSADTFIDEIYPLNQLQAEALSESIRLDHSSYNMFYFVLARRLGATLFTTDKKLAELCLDNGVNCISEVKM